MKVRLERKELSDLEGHKILIHCCRNLTEVAVILTEICDFWRGGSMLLGYWFVLVLLLVIRSRVGSGGKQEPSSHYTFLVKLFSVM